VVVVVVVPLNLPERSIPWLSFSNVNVRLVTGELIGWAGVMAWNFPAPTPVMQLYTPPLWPPHNNIKRKRQEKLDESLFITEKERKKKKKGISLLMLDNPITNVS
jgi:hypothetical protein